MLARFRMPALAVTIGAAALALPLLSLAAPAQAAAGGNGGGPGPAFARASAPSVINSTTFAGYVASVAPGSATSSAAQFKVPRLSCTTAFRAIAPGVAVNNTRSTSSALVLTSCYHGRAGYFPVLDINDDVAFPAMRVRAGDVIKVSVKVTTRGTTVQVTDVTAGVTKRRTGPGARSSTAVVGDSGWSVNGITAHRRARLRDPHLCQLPCRREGSGSLASCPVPARDQQRHPPDRHRGAVASGHRVPHALQALLARLVHEKSELRLA